MNVKGLYYQIQRYIGTGNIEFANFFFLKVGFKVNYHFSSKSMQIKIDLARAVHNKKKPQRHLLEKNGTCKLFKISQEFPENYSGKIWRNFLV